MVEPQVVDSTEPDETDNCIALCEDLVLFVHKWQPFFTLGMLQDIDALKKKYKEK